MWNPFRKNKKSALRDVSSVFALLEQSARKGLLYWQRKDRILLVEESLAVVMLAKGKDGFCNFLDNAALWQTYKLMSEAYEQYRIEVETKAVREAQAKQKRIMTAADIQRIRQHARENMPMLDPDKLEYVREFDIMIIRASSPSAAEASEDNGQLLALGHYNGKQLEMATYEDVKANIL